MSVTLFSPDIFSRPEPAFKPATPEIYKEVSDVLEKYYGFDSGSVVAVERLGGLEINSKNFRIHTRDKLYAFKRSGPQAKLDDCRSQLAVTKALYNQGLALPRLIDSKEGAPYALTDSSQIWILSEFIEGSYFTGAQSHYSSSIKAIAALQVALEGYDGAQALPLSAAALMWDKTAIIFEELFRRSAEWDNIFPPEECRALQREAEKLKISFEATSVYEKTSVKNIVATHIDLHPHNILMKNDYSPIIVDIDSLRRADKTQSLAFAVFKLTRQYLVHEKPKDLAAPAREFMGALQVKDNEKEMFFMAATAEVLRRIGIIADLNMHKHNRDWNAVLHLQLAALHELPLVFGKA